VKELNVRAIPFIVPRDWGEGDMSFTASWTAAGRFVSVRVFEREVYSDREDEGDVRGKD
jgi:hypothetical protein